MTHQKIMGISDLDMVLAVLATHEQQFDEGYWAVLDGAMGELGGGGADIHVLDIGCGPGLFLRDLLQRYPQVRATGTDVTEAMLEHARGLEYPGAAPVLHRHDVTREPLPLAAGSVALVTISAVLHLFDDPFAVLAEIRRVLEPRGRLLVYDWVRHPLRDYLGRRTERAGGEEERLQLRERWLRLFAVHNKYTPEDWRWLLGESGFEVRREQRVRDNFVLLLAG